MTSTSSNKAFQFLSAPCWNKVPDEMQLASLVLPSLARVVGMHYKRESASETDKNNIMQVNIAILSAVDGLFQRALPIPAATFVR